MFTIVRDLARQNMEFLSGLLLFAVIVGLIVVSYFSPYSATAIYLLPPDMPPDGEYWLGTTSRGQDVFWQLTTALRNTLFFGIGVAFISRIISLVVGLVAGYAGGAVDRVLMAINDSVMVIPQFPLLILFYFVLKDSMTWTALILIMASLGWSYDARLIRSVAISLKTRSFTTQSVYSGMSMRKILVEEHLPYVLPIVFATTMNNMIWSIGMEITLSVLGFTDIETPTMGMMIYWANAHSALISGIWWWVAAPVAVIVVLFLALFLLSMSMNEYNDPRSRLNRMGS
ncbi:ABC transporter permease [Rhizobium laguerreae]|uniref:ABC transporter permease n=1 Tax=Rhizobium laguerreae TaxID=1076926 RepID=UPI001C90ED3C|nr:ABC transporter permease [Rhizobium laguerreae]MBY3049754.1 ABC transporter permease [Rhizobium laguerreae]